MSMLNPMNLSTNSLKDCSSFSQTKRMSSIYLNRMAGVVLYAACSD